MLNREFKLYLFTLAFNLPVFSIFSYLEGLSFNDFLWHIAIVNLASLLGMVLVLFDKDVFKRPVLLYPLILYIKFMDKLFSKIFGFGVKECQ